MKNYVYALQENDINCQPIKLHMIKMETSWYREIRVIEGIVTRSLTRWCNFWNWRTKRFEKWHSFPRFTRYNGVQHKVRQQISEELKGEWDEIPVVHHESAYTFFESIGYDYKDKSMRNLDTLILKHPKEK